MQRRFFGEVQVPVLGLGTWQMEGDPRAGAVAAIRRAVELGLTHIDTAEMYGAGIVEELVGFAIASTRARDGIFLVSKVLPQNASRQGTIDACERSLKRLKTDRLDSYLLHWPGEHPLEETFAGFEQLAKDGKIRSWGVSNFDVNELDEAVRIAGKGRIVCNQVLYHLQERAIEHAVMPACAKHGIAVVAYSPLGSGHFPKPPSPGGRVLARIADTHRATPRQIALAFLTRSSGVFAIPKSSDPSHVDELAGADGVSLSDGDVAAIDEAFPLGRSKALPSL